MLEVRCEQARESFGRQVDLLEQERLAAGEAEPLEVERRRAELELERVRRPPRRPIPAEPRSSRVVGSRPRVCISSVKLRLPPKFELEAGMEDERAAAAGPLDALLAGELRERPPDGDQAAAVALGELALGRQPVARLPLARVERGHQVEIDLVVQRDGTELEPETGHRRAWILLRAARMVITL